MNWMVSKVSSREESDLQHTGVQAWQGLTTLAIVLMELSWLTLWYRLLLKSHTQSSVLQVYAVFGFILLSNYLLISVLHVLRPNDLIHNAILLSFLFVSMYVGVRALIWSAEPLTLESVRAALEEDVLGLPSLLLPELATAFVTGLIWRRAAILSIRSPGPLGVMRSFRFGVFMFITYSVIATVADERQGEVEFFIFMLSGLIALAGSRLSFVSWVRGGRRQPFQSQRVLDLLAYALVLIVAALGVGYLVRGSFSDLLREGFIAIFGGLIELFIMLLRPISYVAFSVAQWLLERIIPPNVEEPTIATEALEFVDSALEKTVAVPTWIVDLKDVFVLIVIGAVVLLVLFMLIAGLRKRSRGLRRSQVDESESLLSAMEMVRRLRNVFLRKAGDTLQGLRRLRPLERRLAAARVRRIYRHVLRLAEDLGVPRPAPKTPMEFMPQLEKLFPECKAELKFITQMYLRVRYGEYPETHDEVEHVLTAWEVIRDEGEMIRQKR